VKTILCVVVMLGGLGGEGGCAPPNTIQGACMLGPCKCIRNWDTHHTYSIFKSWKFEWFGRWY